MLQQNTYIYVQGGSRVQDITGGNYFLDLGEKKTLLSPWVLFSNIIVFWLCFNSCKCTAAKCTEWYCTVRGLEQIENDMTKSQANIFTTK